jgi:2,4-dienoyl-CoA reductase-like NADH-dependent reductase (Old Yellow Enzyme family)
MEKSEFDLIAVGRALLADPHWANKVKEGQFDQLKTFSPSSFQALS